MRNALRTLTLVVACAALLSIDLQACGDKYLRLASRLGAGYRAEHPATVLIYMPPDSSVLAAAKALRLHDALRRARHQVHTVERSEDLTAALAARTYDIVLADASAATTLTPMLRRAVGRPSLVPVFGPRQTKDQLADVRRSLGCLIAARERVSYAIAEIDHVMEQRRGASSTP
jgi:hypothetical protein